MHINCEKLVETFLLNKNPLYTFSLPISLIISIIVFGIAVNNNWSINSYILQILINFCNKLDMFLIFFVAFLLIVLI